MHDFEVIYPAGGGGVRLHPAPFLYRGRETKSVVPIICVYVMY